MCLHDSESKVFPIEYFMAIKGVAIMEGRAHEDFGDVFYYWLTLLMSRFSEDCIQRTMEAGAFGPHRYLHSCAYMYSSCNYNKIKFKK